MHATTLFVVPEATLPGRRDDLAAYRSSAGLHAHGIDGSLLIESKEHGYGDVRESEDALRATDEAAARIRGGVEEATGGTIASVENYEVVVFEASSS